MRPRVRLAAALLALVVLPLSVRADDSDAPDPRRPISLPERSELAAGIGNAAGIAFDVVVLRPIGFTAVVLGAVYFVPTALLSVADRGALRESYDIFVRTPVENTFTRPLGDF